MDLASVLSHTDLTDENRLIYSADAAVLITRIGSSGALKAPIVS